MKNSRFAFTWMLGIALIYQSLPVNAGDAVPVLIWDGETNGSPPIPVNPLQKTSQSEFEKILMKKVGGSQRPVVVFVRDSLCTEDLTQHKEGLMHLKDGGTFVYLPAVESPLSVFENLQFYNQTTEEELESISDGQLILTQAADLDAVSETFNMVKESSPNLIAALTGKSCGYSISERVRRAADDTTTTPAPTPVSNTSFIIKSDRILMYTSDTPTLQVSTEKDSKTEYLNYTTDGNGTETSPLQVVLQYKVMNTTSNTEEETTVSLQFLPKTVGYRYVKVTYKNQEGLMTLMSKVDTIFGSNFSYHCSNDMTFSNATVQFTVKDFQVQMDVEKFGDAYDCVGFTSIPIWAGIFVTAILALIMIWGLTMIMDIRTMDRFDDPKGKTITISASE